MRIRMRRSRGWRLQAQSPDGRPVVYVGRPTKWGNPFVVGVEAADIAESVRLFAAWLDGSMDAARAKKAGAERRVRILAHIAELQGKHLACWCPLTRADGSRHPCHADVLIDLANGRTSAIEPEPGATSRR